MEEQTVTETYTSPPQGKSNLKIMIVALILIVSVAVAGAYFILSGFSEHDCGTDTECLMSALSTCSPATGIMEKNIGFGDSKISVKISVEGERDGKCVFTETVDVLEFGGFENPTESISESLEILESLEGSSMRCSVPKNVEPSVLDSQIIYDYCIGGMKIRLESLEEISKDYLEGVISSTIEIRDYYCSLDESAVIIIANTGTVNVDTGQIEIIGEESGDPVTGTWTDSEGSQLTNGEIEAGNTAKWESPAGLCASPDACTFSVKYSSGREQKARILC